MMMKVFRIYIFTLATIFVALFLVSCSQEEKFIVNLESAFAEVLSRENLDLIPEQNGFIIYFDENFVLQKTEFTSELSEFEIIFPKGNILPVLIEFNTNSLEKIYAGKLYPVTEEFSVHSAFCSYIYQKLLRCSNQDFKTSNDFCKYFNWNKFCESILKFENPFLLDSDLICYDISINQFSARSLKLKE
jgi:hypothetical protein